MIRCRVTILFTLVLLICAPLFGHHGTGGTYEMDKPVTLKGTITMFQFANPHVLLYFDVPDANKKGATVGQRLRAVKNWLGEGPSIINWTKTGWNRNSLKASIAKLEQGKDMNP